MLLLGIWIEESCCFLFKNWQRTLCCSNHCSTSQRRHWRSNRPEKAKRHNRIPQGAVEARNGKETEIAPTTKSPTDYDLIVIGTPIWNERPTPAIRTYLKKSSLAGKKVAVFFVQGRKKPQGIEQIKTLMPESKYAGELSLSLPLRHKVEAEKQIALWCDRLTTG